MVVFISDLHFRDNQDRTIAATTTQGFLQKSLIPQIVDAGATHIEVVFLGDLVDINRSEYWLDPQLAGEYRPWSNWKEALRQLPDEAVPDRGSFKQQEFETHITHILDRIASANARNYELWEQFRIGDKSVWGKIASPPEIRFSYVPGNHDRLAQYSIGTRDKIIQQFAISPRDQSSGKALWDKADPFDWIQQYINGTVVAFHGHILDPFNFGGGNAFIEGKLTQDSNPIRSPWYFVPSLGDAVAVLFGCGIARELEKSGLASGSSLKLPLEELDLVRPQSASLLWLQKWGLEQHPDVQITLDRAVESIFNGFMDDEFVGWSKARLLSFWEKIELGITKFFGSFKSIKGALDAFETVAGGSEPPEEYEKSMARFFLSKQFAHWLPEAFPNARYFVSGHTHRPTIIPLVGTLGDDARAEKIYFNTGTWLDTIKETSDQSGFARRNQITHVSFYDKGEELQGASQSYWEYWQGGLRRGPAF